MLYLLEKNTTECSCSENITQKNATCVSKQNAYLIRNPIGSWIMMIWIIDLENAESQGGSNGAIGNVLKCLVF